MHGKKKRRCRKPLMLRKGEGHPANAQGVGGGVRPAWLKPLGIPRKTPDEDSLAQKDERKKREKEPTFGGGDEGKGKVTRLLLDIGQPALVKIATLEKERRVRGDNIEKKKHQRGLNGHRKAFRNTHLVRNFKEKRR